MGHGQTRVRVGATLVEPKAREYANNGLLEHGAKSHCTKGGELFDRTGEMIGGMDD
jgi:hypothetical protein